MSSRKYAVATVFVVLMTLFIDHLYFSLEKPPLNKTIPIETQGTELNEPEARSTLVPKLRQMSLVNTTLPLPPAHAESHSAELNLEQDKASQAYQQFSKQAQTSMNLNASDTQLVIKPHSINDNSSEPNKFQVAQRLNQLVALKGIDRTLYFPDANTRQILAYMHNCVGIDIGAVKDNNLTLFSHKNSAHSQIVRAANGFKTPQETALLAAYAPNQVLVRLYPKWFDERLGKEIASSLGKQALTQLSGNYALRGQSLWLTEVNLNSKPVSRDWLLSQGC